MGSARGPFGIAPILWILALSLLWRVFFAAVLPLGTDEAYALAVGRSFAISFYDHPPLGFWAPALAEDVLGATGPLGYRIPNLVLGTLAVWFLYLAGRRLGGESAGLWTALLAALAPFMALSGVMILPDAPLYAGMTGALYALIRLAQGETDRFWLWVFGGLCLAVALASKYQAGLLPVSLLVWIAVTRSAWGWLARPGFWLAVGLALLGLLPVLLWNIGNGWASFAFHGGRAGGGVNPANFALMVVAQALYLLPVILVWGVGRLLSRDLWREPVPRLLILIALGPIVMFNAIYLFSSGTLPHWSMPGWMVLLPLMGTWLAQRPGHAARRWLFGLAVPIHLLLAGIALHVQTGLLTAASDPPPGWDNTVPLIPMAETRAAMTASGYLDGADLLAATGWTEAGHLAAALGRERPMRVIEGRAHHFAFMPGQSIGGAALLIGIARLSDGDSLAGDLLETARRFDPDARLLGVVAVERGSRPYFALPVVALSLDPLPAPAQEGTE
jgi:4-amino-4-deoxy-L-arabinose transferase-like glycosyltransferase